MHTSGISSRTCNLEAHVNYTDPGLSREHFQFVARQRARARGKGGLGHARIYVSKCSQERPGSV